MEFSKAAILDLHAAFHDCMGVVLDHIASVPFEVLTRELAGRRAEREVMAATRTYLESIDERGLNSMLARYHEEWTTPHRTPAFILMHVITHGFHHKGQIVAMLRLLGYPSPDTDLQRS